MKKILTLLLAFSLALCSFSLVSCNEEEVPSAGDYTHEQAMDILEMADKATTSLDSSYSYKSTVKVESPSHPEMNDTFSQLVAESMPGTPEATYDGANRRSSVNMLGANVEAIHYDGYTYISVTSYGITIKNKVAMDDDDRDTFHGTAELPLKYSLFKNVNVAKNDGENCYTVTWTDITFAGREELEERMSAMGSLTGVTLGYENVKLVCEIVNGRYASVDLVFPFNITAGSETATLVTTTSLTFDYENFTPVTAPEDADEYIEIDLDVFEERFQFDFDED